ncbi:hypothetical protein Bca4012_031150 [Brassica carinata]|uniref:Uncharacterized protein n=1 Tax=Brassica carinata TaxID=52824 RepID=A0A8X7RHK7_BRACI|nr:hypothetical protein Bca52824_047601 [Brassica carinata]
MMPRGAMRSSLDKYPSRDGASDGEVSLPDFVPCCYHPGGIFEDLPALPAEQMRSPVVEGQLWENVEETRSTPSSEKALLRKCGGAGVTFLIPTKSQRPWSRPLGFQCVYERRDAAICQFFNGAFRTSVVLMVTAAEIDVSMSVQTLEELTYTKSMGDVDHPDMASYPEDFVSDARVVVSRVQVRDWRSDLPPLITGNKRRFSIFSSDEKKIINAAREMRELPDLSALIKKKLSGAKKASSATLSETTPSETTPPAPLPPNPLPLTVSPRPSVGPVNAESSREDLMRTSEWETAEPSVTDGNKKKRSAPDSSASAASQARTESDGPPKKKKKKMEKKKKKPVEGHSEPIGDIEGRKTAIEEGSSRDAAARAVVEGRNLPVVMSRLLLLHPLLLRRLLQLRLRLSLKVVQPRRSVGSNFTITWNSSMSARLHFLTPRLNALNLFDRLKVVARTCLQSRTLSSRTHIADSVACQKEGQKAHFMEKFGELKDKFEDAGAKIRGLVEEKNAWTREKAALEEKMVSTALRHLKEVNRLRDSRGYEVSNELVCVQTAMIAKSNQRFTKIRDLEKRCGEFETARSLQSQAFWTKKCLGALNESGTDIPH